jgi:acyl-CoA-binding protein
MEVNAVRKLGETIAHMIDPSSKLPSQLAFFPLEGKIPNSEQYINDNFMGYSFFRNAFIANYNLKGTPFNVFIIPNASAEETKAMLQALLKNNGMDQPNLQPGIFDIKDKYNGTMKVIWKGKYLCGVYNTANTDIMQNYIALIDVNLK